jgi:hypothetical protein
MARAINNGIDTLDLSVIHIDSSNYLPSRRVSAGGGRRLRRTFILRSAKKTLLGIRVVGQAMRPDSVGTDRSNNGIDTLDLSVIHIDSSNYLPSRRVSAGGGRRPPSAD